MNPCAERFNRTIQEQFVDYHEDQLFHDLPGFNRKLADWLVDCNTVLIHNQPECQRGWAYTRLTKSGVFVV
ncbi:hypothetical protein [Candidatus Spongiihabitans sp.]|uniref:hypothetical protein n=1 Tax=Candidatus Spongiihabitans sp. TaxID=3101308 RepID=UPI003C6F4E42